MALRQKIYTAEEIAAGKSAAIPFLRPPRRDVFRDRADRLRHLSAAHPMAEFLLFTARIAEQQQLQLDNMPIVPLPLPEKLELCRAHDMPPLNAQSFARDRVWCDMLRRMLRGLLETDELLAPVREVIKTLEGQRDEFYEAQASKLLAGITFGLDMATAPLIGAALQVYWVHMTAVLGNDAFSPIDVAGICPCCGQQPTASIARLGADESGGRFLHCSLCATEWHMVRIKCASCEATEHIHYESIDDGRPGTRHAVKAECCDDCNSYLKIMYQDRDPQVDPVADDLATLALDLMIGDGGRQSGGVNLMLLHGDPGDS